MGLILQQTNVVMFKGSKKQLLDSIKHQGTLSIDEAVSKTGLAKTTVREHLLQLERDGYVERTYNRSGRGRPSLHYELSPKGQSLYPSSESTLIREFLNYLKQQEKEKLIEDFFEDFWQKRVEEAERRMEQISAGQMKDQLHVLTDMLEAEGFMPEFTVDDDKQKATIKECNCPFREVVKETQLPCKLEKLFYKKLFNAKIERTTHIAQGDYACTYEFSAEGSSSD